MFRDINCRTVYTRGVNNVTRTLAKEVEAELRDLIANWVVRPNDTVVPTRGSGDVDDFDRTCCSSTGGKDPE
jgi:hypothetical protein